MQRGDWESFPSSLSSPVERAVSAPQIPREQSQTVGRMSLEKPLYVMQSLAAYVFHNRTHPSAGSSEHGEQRPRGGSGRFVLEVWSFFTPHPSSPPSTTLPRGHNHLPPRSAVTVPPSLFPPAHSLAGEVWFQIFQRPQPASPLGVREALPSLSKFQATARKEGASHPPFILDEA